PTTVWASRSYSSNRRTSGDADAFSRANASQWPDTDGSYSHFGVLTGRPGLLRVPASQSYKMTSELPFRACWYTATFSAVSSPPLHPRPRRSRLTAGSAFFFRYASYRFLCPGRLCDQARNESPDTESMPAAGSASFAGCVRTPTAVAAQALTAIARTAVAAPVPMIDLVCTSASFRRPRSCRGRESLA